jgi:1,4-alpha-glucan branching enzyme
MGMLICIIRLAEYQVGREMGGRGSAVCRIKSVSTGVKLCARLTHLTIGRRSLPFAASRLYRAGLERQQQQQIRAFMAKTDESKSVQEFFFSAPEANSVQLVGDFTHWQRQPINLVKQANGVWQTSVALAAGSYHYRFLVDGAWCDDPQCTLRIPNIFGSHNMVREVSSSAEVMAQPKSTEKKAGRRRTSKSA